MGKERRKREIARRLAVFAVGCVLTTAATTLARGASDGTDEPRHFVPFSRVVAELSRQPGSVDALLARMGRDPAAGGILGREQIEKLRQLILGKDWEALDHFPTLSVEEMGRAVLTAGEARPATEPSAARAMSAEGSSVVEPLGIPTGGVPPRAESFLRPVGFGLVVATTSTRCSRRASRTRAA